MNEQLKEVVSKEWSSFIAPFFWKLIEEFKDKRSGNISLVKNEMKCRYKENVGDDRIKISIAFKNSSAGDKAWIEHQERKERNGGEQNKKA